VKRPRVCVLRTAGTNCDKETAFAFKLAGGLPELLHINTLVSGERSLDEFSILALPGGFTYGDDIAAGRIFANELRFKLAQALKDFIRQGRLIIGICNGFQILVKAGLLPGSPSLSQEVTLTINDSAKFEDRWVRLKSQPTDNRCVWARGLPEVVYLPVAHGEGKFVARDQAVMERLEKNSQVVFRYCDAEGRQAGYPANPNGSQAGVAGICDETGRILGLMPHPERHMADWQHPAGSFGAGRADGLLLFKTGVEYAHSII